MASFLRSPVEVLADESTGRARGIKMEINRLEVSTSLAGLTCFIIIIVSRETTGSPAKL